MLLDDGTVARTGVISLGEGHADHQLGVRGAIKHYDSTSTGVADVCVGEDEWGIWCAGWIRPGTTDEQVIALRASDVSGDWREVAGRQEMVAALAVNVAGLPVARVHDGVQVALVAAGVVHQETETDPVGDLADAIMARLDARAERRERMKALVERVRRDRLRWHGRRTTATRSRTTSRTRTRAGTACTATTSVTTSTPTLDRTPLTVVLPTHLWTEGSRDRMQLRREERQAAMALRVAEG